MTRAVAAGAALAFLAAAPDPAAAQPAEAVIEQRLRQWTEDFNAAHGDRLCDLFSESLVANYQGQPEKRYAPLCDALRDAVAEDGPHGFAYRLELEEIIVSGDLAVVRLIWHLTMRDRKTGTETRSSDRGLDVFRREADGTWRIVRYIGYQMP